MPKAPMTPNQLTPTDSANDSVHKDHEFVAAISVGIRDPTQPREAERSAPQPISDQLPQARSARL